MEIITSVTTMQRWSRAVHRQGQTVAFVPTMGYLHEGHLALIRAAQTAGDEVVVSLFVNPAQFGPQEDFAHYPRDRARDEALCRDADVAACFIPATEEMYAPDHQIYMEEPAAARLLEGAHRPGHFRGVLTVVAKLFGAVQPDVAVFGEKDAQQLWLVEKLVADLNFPVRIMAHPTVREPDGLAMSSRNKYLQPAQRERATCLYRALQVAAQKVAAGETRAAVVLESMQPVLATVPEARIDYVALVDPGTFRPLEQEVSTPCRAVLAVRIGSTRLIDTMLLSAGNET